MMFATSKNDYVNFSTLRICMFSVFICVDMLVFYSVVTVGCSVGV